MNGPRPHGHVYRWVLGWSDRPMHGAGLDCAVEIWPVRGGLRHVKWDRAADSGGRHRAGDDEYSGPGAAVVSVWSRTDMGWVMAAMINFFSSVFFSVHHNKTFSGFFRVFFGVFFEVFFGVFFEVFFGVFFVIRGWLWLRRPVTHLPCFGKFSSWLVLCLCFCNSFWIFRGLLSYYVQLFFFWSIFFEISIQR